MSRHRASLCAIGALATFPAAAQVGVGGAGAPAGTAAEEVRFAPRDELREDFWVTDDLIEDVELYAGDLYLAGAFDYVGPHTGPFASVDAATGVPDVSLPRLEGEVFAVESDGQGGWFVGGEFQTYAPVIQNLVHLHADGSFDGVGLTDVGPVHGLLRDGTTLYVVGRFKKVSGVDRALAFAVDTGADLLLDWNPTEGANLPSSHQARTLTRIGDTLWVGGWFDGVFQGQSRRNLFAAGADGTLLDLDLDPDSTVSVLHGRPGLLFLGGWFQSVGGQTRSFFALVDPDTGLPKDFQPVLSSGVEALATVGETLYMGGSFKTADGQPRERLAAFDLVTETLLPWAPDATLDDGSGAAVRTIAADGGAVYVGGSFQFVGGARRKNLAALDPVLGTVLPLSGNADGRDSSGVHAIVPAGDALGVGGKFHLVGGVYRTGLAKLDRDSGTTEDWFPYASAIIQPGQAADLQEIEVGPDLVYVAGQFESLNGVPRLYLGAVERLTGEVSTTFDPRLEGLSGKIQCLELVGDVLYVSGTFETPVDGYEDTVALDAHSGTVLGNFQLLPGQSVLDARVAAGALFVVGGFGQIGNPPESRLRIAALDPANAAVLPWITGASDAVRTLAVKGSTLYVGGEFLLLDGFLRRYVGAIDAVTDAVLPWDPAVDGPGTTYVDALAAHGGLVFVGGRFNTIGATWRPGLGAVDAETGAVHAWDPGGSWSVASIATDGQVLVAAGDFNRMNGRPWPHLAVFPLERE